MKRPLFDHFSLLAPFYDHVIGTTDVDRLRELLDLPVRGRLLDAGGGTGRVAQALRGMAAEIVVTDVSPPMLRRAAAKDGLHTVLAHAEFLPFGSGTFERVVVVDALHHFCDQRQAIADLWRVLAPGGRLVVEEPNVDTRIAKLVALFEKLTLMNSRFYPPRAIQGFFEDLGGRVSVHTDHPFNAWIVVDKPFERVGD